jgi:hypothetical protein
VRTAHYRRNQGEHWVPSVLTMNGLTMPDDFPTAAFERVWRKVNPKSATHHALYLEFSSAWNALAHRYLAMVDHGNNFTASVLADGTSPAPDRRHFQEQCLFDFFSSGFSAFDSFFYSAFAAGSLIDSVAFPLATAADQRNVSIGHTLKTYQQLFPHTPIGNQIATFASDHNYTQWRDIRNILTHRAAPVRIFLESPGSKDVTPVDSWKVFAIPVDEHTIPMRRAHASLLVSGAVDALADFVELQL